MSTQVSVVIPIFNVEKYLAECLDSVLAQTLEDIEVICVNDGSTDSSLDILRSYEEKDPRIVVIDKPNGGYGHSVNRGLEQAHGEWISIVEPDDLIDPRMYEDLLSLAGSPADKTADIVKGSYWLYFDLEEEESGNGGGAYVERPNLMNFMPQGFCDLDVRFDPEVLRHHPSIWSAVYRRAFIEEHGIRMIEPKGAGWADNPWFFETILQADRIVWTPAPYYYYRQTNPDASSKLKDFHLPFDRLRDIRAIYERFGITTKDFPTNWGITNGSQAAELTPEQIVVVKLLGALYARSFNYICESILEEFSFPENDPELQALIQEVFDSMDEDVLTSPYGGVPRGKLNYYRDFTGKRLAKVAKHEAPANPKVSFVIPMQADRKGLWETLNSILRQQYENFEVICVDCGSPDRSFEIAQGLAGIDKRFRALSGFKTIADGCNAGLQTARGEYVHFLRPGIALEDAFMLRRCVTNLDTLPNGADIIIQKRWFPASRLIPRGFEVKALEFPMAGIECDIALATFPTMYTRMFRRSFLLSEGIAFDNPADKDGFGLVVKTAALAKTAAFVACRDVRIDTHGNIERAQWKEENDIIAHMLTKYGAFASAAEQMGSDTAWRVARSCIVCHLAIDVARLGRARSGLRYFEALRNVFEGQYGIRESHLTDYANYLDYGVLVEAFSLSYEDYSKNLLRRQEKSLIDITYQRDTMGRTIDRIRHSGSFILGQRVAQGVKSFMPKQATLELKDRMAED